MRSSFVALAVMLAVACGRDALVDVPGGPGMGSLDGSSTPPNIPGVPQTTGGVGGGAGGSGGSGGRATPDAARPPPPTPVDAATPRPPDAAPMVACDTVPACLVKMASLCPTSMIGCVSQRTGGVTSQCYANNVKLSVTVAGPGITVRVARADGNLCYTLAGTIRSSGMGPQGSQLTYSDVNSLPIATGTLQGGGQVVLSCVGGAPVSVPLACAPGATALAGLAGIGGTSTCSNGMCVAP
jgi:hypothetical protein